MILNKSTFKNAEYNCKTLRKERAKMKIWSFDGKKRIIDSFDDEQSPFYLGRKFNTVRENEAENAGANPEEEKQIEK